MTLPEAKKLAKDIVGHSVAVAHRNVWMFCNDEKGDLIITKDDAPVNRAGVFFSYPESDEIVDISSGEVVSFKDVFGKAFFEDKPYLSVDNMTAGIDGLEEKIDALVDLAGTLLKKAGTSFVAMIMVDDLIEAYDELAYRRLVVLNNYLATCNTPISTTEFAYLHHELYTLK